MNQDKKEAQIFAITKAIEQGKAKNKWAALNKIKQLKKQLEQIKWNNFLAQ